MPFNQDDIFAPDVRMQSANKQHSTPENTFTIDHHRRRSLRENDLSPPPRRHSHHAPVCKFDADKWKTEFRRKSLDTLTHEQRFMAAQQRRGLEVMDTTDEDREFEEERQRIADDSMRHEYERYMSLMQQHRYMTDMFLQQQAISPPPEQQSYADPVRMERTTSKPFDGQH
ncbi:hypothetical protein INT43_004540 [Umbelopsis isabellina]|uniref:Uncharacterized protein n=1 Tax=Mortierella isabellina TaxID=91625 RepID=A0A8H7U9A5_MORIS|nr:hypothetical protein INT43_004540 [Umbelopsis isabellina]